MNYKLNTNTFQYEESEDGIEDICFAVLLNKTDNTYMYVRHGSREMVENYFNRENEHIVGLSIGDSYRMIGEEPIIVSMKDMNWSLNDVNKILSICDYINILMKMETISI